MRNLDMPSYGRARAGLYAVILGFLAVVASVVLAPCAHASVVPPTRQVSATVALTAPVDGAVTSPYGMRLHPVLHVWKLHDGLDFSTACGTPVRASAAGTVTSVAYLNGYGNQVGVDHGFGIATSYSHLSAFAVKPGGTVTRGQVIGYAGKTGYATGCHVHFMVYVNGQAVNPATYLSVLTTAAIKVPTFHPRVMSVAKQTAKPAGTHAYVVKAGDTLSGIAEHAGLSGYHGLHAANHDTVKDPNLIFVGQVLNVPNVG